VVDYSKNMVGIKGFPVSAKVACQGIEGAFSQSAAETLFAKPDIIYAPEFRDVFEAVDKGLAKYGILPIENSNAGSVTEVYDLFKSYKFFIVRAVKMPVEHFLLGTKGATLENIKEVHTHHMAVKQCTAFLKKYPHIKVVISANTAEAAKFISQSGRKDIAAIASQKCAKVYNLSVLKKNIEDSSNNCTRFICISKECEVYNDADKISIMLTLEHRAGSLYEVIKFFADNNLNLTKLESRPITGSNFEFMFYFDLEAKLKDKSVSDLIDKLKKTVPYFLFLGNYREV